MTRGNLVDLTRTARLATTAQPDLEHAVMITHFLRITTATAFIILCSVLPFLPGRYDAMAVPLSMLAQLFGKVGLLLVPVGAFWAAAETWSGSARTRYVFAITALIASSVVWLIISIGALFESLTLGIFALVCGGYGIARLLPRLKSPNRAVAFYLLIVPVAVTLIQLVIGEPLTDFSRDRAIRNSAPLIADIERYRAANGRYPLSLVSVNKDYWPSVIGIRDYQYEPRGDAYNLLFEQITFELGTKEIVMYNPRGEHAMTSHAMDVLQLTPEQLALDQTRGHNSLHDAPQPNWKYFRFD